MERLTVKCDDGHWGLSLTVYDKAIPSRILEKLPIAIDRLAAYEDSGLSPEMVEDLLERFQSLYNIFDDLSLVDRVHFQAFLERVQHWYKAEKDGRLAVLPFDDI